MQKRSISRLALTIAAASAVQYVHAEAGGAFLSNWRAAGIGLMFTLGLAALMFAVLMIFDI